MTTTWAELISVFSLTSFGKRISETVWEFDVPMGDTGRAQTVSVIYEPMSEGNGVIVVRSLVTITTASETVAAAMPISVTAEADVMPVLREVGQILVGGIGYVPLGEGRGGIAVSNVFPLNLLDMSDSSAFLRYLGLVAGIADRFEAIYSRQYGKTNPHDVF